MRRATFRPYEGQEPFIFISYAHKNSDQVMPILEKLDEAGYRVWYDDGIAPGSEWPEYIAEHLNACSVVIAFVSQQSIDSPNCRREVTYALAKQKPFLGVVLEQAKMSPGMELQLAAQQCILRYNFRTEEEFLNKLLTSSMLKSCQRPKENVQIAVQTGSSSVPPQTVSETVQTVQNNTAGSSRTGETPKTAANKKKSLIWIIAGALGLLAVVIIGSIIIGGRSRVDNDPESGGSQQKTSAHGTEAVVSGDTKAGNSTAAGTEANSSEEALPGESTEAPTEEAEKEPLKGEMEKLTSVSIKDGWDYEVISAGVGYLDGSSGLLGIQSFDGSSDTGACYSLGAVYGEYKDYEGLYLVVTHDGSEWAKTPDSLNRFGLIGPKGEEILPEEYASIVDANEYYALCIKVSGEAANAEEAVTSFPADRFDKADESGKEIPFKGEWMLVSLKTGQPVPGISGTKAEEYDNWKYGHDLFGELIELEYNKKYMLADGRELPAGAEVFRNGTYLVTEPSKGTVYRANGTEIFSFDPNDRSLFEDQHGSGYFSRRKLDDGYGYTLLDKKGQPISAEIAVAGTSTPSTLGPFVLARSGGLSAPYQAYDLNGKLLTEKTVETFGSEYDPVHRVLKLKTSDGGFLFVKEGGEILAEIGKEEGSIFSFLVRKDNFYYNFSTGNYDIQGGKVADFGWVSVRNDGGKYDLVDAFTGANLLRGYDYYRVAVSPEYGVIVGAGYNQTIDIFVLR